MVRRPLVALAGTLAAGTALLGCRPATVSVAFTPAVGDRYAYRYEIVATITRTVEGEAPAVTHVDTVLTARQTVQARRDDGARIRLELTREGGSTRRVVAVVDRAGSLEGVELVEGLGSKLGGIGGDAIEPTHLPGPPDRPLAPGERWSIDLGDRRGEGRLERLGVIDGSDVAVVRTTATEDLSRSVRAGASATEVHGQVRSGATTSYDLDDGATRRSRSRSRGEVQAVFEPPPGVDADPVRATIAFEVTVKVTRIA
jgi:hypothetical protein